MIVNDVREYFKNELKNENFIIDRTGSKTIEMLGASFIADEDAIFGEVNQDYVNAEIKWYNSMSTNINDIEYGNEPPQAWKYAANKHGEINSNYGYLIFHQKFYEQYVQVCVELLKNPDSRRANMIYTRPSIWEEYYDNGKNDFICTNAVCYYIRDKKLHCVVQMRSNDIWAGYRNDRAWQQYVLNKLADDLDVEVGNIYWQVQNLHCYEKDFYLIDNYIKTGKISIKKSDYLKQMK